MVLFGRRALGSMLLVTALLTLSTLVFVEFGQDVRSMSSTSIHLEFLSNFAANRTKDDELRNGVVAAQIQRPSWCIDKKAKNHSDPVYLGSIIYVRIWPEEDLARLSYDDLAHWLTYYRYAGVERVYLYDTYHTENEKILNDARIRSAVDSGFVVYVDYHDVEVGNLDKNGKRIRSHMEAVQRRAYRDVIKRSNSTVRWMTFTDMDEYPFTTNTSDHGPGFLSRFLQRHDSQSNQNAVTQWKMENIIVEGGRDYNRGPAYIQQVSRVQKKVLNMLQKQIVRMDAAMSHVEHHSHMAFGATKTAAIGELHMRHIWGGRRYGWKLIEDMESAQRDKLIKETDVNDMADIAREVLRCF